MKTIFQLVLLAGIAGATAAAQQQHPITYDDFAAVRAVSDPEISPDGRAVLYAVRTTDVAANRRTGKTYVLPIAGGSGTLSDRFLGGDPNVSSAGWLRAKTGSLTAVNSLAGVVTDASGRVLTFAFISNDAGPMGRVALDALAGVLRTCGCGS